MHKALAFLVTFKFFLVKCKTENSNNSNNNSNNNNNSSNSENTSGSSSAKYPVEITFNKTDDMR